MKRRALVWCIGMIVMLGIGGCGGTSHSSKEVPAEAVTEVETLGGSEEEIPEEAKDDFTGSKIYRDIVSIIDKNFDDQPHDYKYDEAARTLYIYFEAPEKTRERLAAKKKDVKATWPQFMSSQEEFAGKMHEILKDGGQNHSYIVWVDQLHEGNRYTSEDYLAIIQDGTIVYNFSNDSSGNGAAFFETSEDIQGKNGGDSESDFNHAATAEEERALKMVVEYMDSTCCSYSGLVDELLENGFSEEEAVYGADHCGVDWNEQAVEMAREYLSYRAYSKGELSNKLEFEGFTTNEARYAVDVVYR